MADGHEALAICLRSDGSSRSIAVEQKAHQLPATSLPVLLRIEQAGGHGPGKPLSALVEEETDIYAFLLYHLTGGG